MDKENPLFQQFLAVSDQAFKKKKETNQIYANQLILNERTERFQEGMKKVAETPRDLNLESIKNIFTQIKNKNFVRGDLRVLQDQKELDKKANEISKRRKDQITTNMIESQKYIGVLGNFLTLHEKNMESIKFEEENESQLYPSYRKKFNLPLQGVSKVSTPPKSEEINEILERVDVGVMESGEIGGISGDRLGNKDPRMSSPKGTRRMEFEVESKELEEGDYMLGVYGAKEKIDIEGESYKNNKDPMDYKDPMKYECLQYIPKESKTQFYMNYWSPSRKKGDARAKATPNTEEELRIIESHKREAEPPYTQYASTSRATRGRDNRDIRDPHTHSPQSLTQSRSISPPLNTNTNTSKDIIRDYRSYSPVKVNPEFERIIANHPKYDKYIIAYMKRHGIPFYPPDEELIQQIALDIESQMDVEREHQPTQEERQILTLKRKLPEDEDLQEISHMQFREKKIGLRVIDTPEKFSPQKLERDRKMRLEGENNFRPEVYRSPRSPRSPQGGRSTKISRDKASRGVLKAEEHKKNEEIQAITYQKLMDKGTNKQSMLNEKAQAKLRKDDEQVSAQMNFLRELLYVEDINDDTEEVQELILELSRIVRKTDGIIPQSYKAKLQKYCQTISPEFYSRPVIANSLLQKEMMEVNLQPIKSSEKQFKLSSSNLPKPGMTKLIEETSKLPPYLRGCKDYPIIREYRELLDDYENSLVKISARTISRLKCLTNPSEGCELIGLVILSMFAGRKDKTFLASSSNSSILNKKWKEVQKFLSNAGLVAQEFRKFIAIIDANEISEGALKNMQKCLSNPILADPSQYYECPEAKLILNYIMSACAHIQFVKRTVAYNKEQEILSQPKPKLKIMTTLEIGNQKSPRGVKQFTPVKSKSPRGGIQFEMNEREAKGQMEKISPKNNVGFNTRVDMILYEEAEQVENDHVQKEKTIDDISKYVRQLKAKQNDLKFKYEKKLVEQKKKEKEDDEREYREYQADLQYRLHLFLKDKVKDDKKYRSEMLNEYLKDKKKVRQNEFDLNKNQWMEEFEKTIEDSLWKEQLTENERNKKMEEHKDFIQKMMIEKDYKQELYAATRQKDHDERMYQRTKDVNHKYNEALKEQTKMEEELALLNNLLNS